MKVDFLNLGGIGGIDFVLPGVHFNTLYSPYGTDVFLDKLANVISL